MMQLETTMKLTSQSSLMPMCKDCSSTRISLNTRTYWDIQNQCIASAEIQPENHTCLACQAVREISWVETGVDDRAPTFVSQMKYYENDDERKADNYMYRVSYGYIDIDGYERVIREIRGIKDESLAGLIYELMCERYPDCDEYCSG